MQQFLNVGYGNLVNARKVVSIIHFDAAPVKRMVQCAKDSGNGSRCNLWKKDKVSCCDG